MYLCSFHGVYNLKKADVLLVRDEQFDREVKRSTVKLFESSIGLKSQSKLEVNFNLHMIIIVDFHATAAAMLVGRRR